MSQDSPLKRCVKLSAKVIDPNTTNKDKYLHSSGFIVSEGVILTVAHGVSASSEVVIRDAFGLSLTLDLSSSPAIIGDPAGPAQDLPPDLALLEAPGIGIGLKPFPLALVSRETRNVTSLIDVEITGYPQFMVASQLREMFHTKGTMSLYTSSESGLFQVSTTYIPASPEAETSSSWEGISGGPLIYNNHLIGVLIEHRPPQGNSSLMVIPLNLIEATPDRPSWGPGVDCPESWWCKLGVNDVAMLPQIPAAQVESRWIRDCRDIQETLQNDVAMSKYLRNASFFSTQAHQVLLEHLRACSDVNSPSVALSDLRRRLLALASSNCPTYFGLTVGQRLEPRNLSELLDDLYCVHQMISDQLPDTSNRIHYRISTPNIDVDLDSELHIWLRAHEGDRVAADLSTRIDVNSIHDSLGELLALIADRETPCEPFKTVKSLVDLVLSGRYSDVSANEQYSKCFARWTRPPFELLSPVDDEPQVLEQNTKGFLVNEKPTISHLRKGYFAPAIDLDELETQYWDWHTREVINENSRVTGRVATFWIIGPSGAGKSILLIQLLARIASRAATSVCYVRNNGSDMTEIVNKAHEFCSARHVIIGLDDPHDTVSTGGATALESALNAIQNIGSVHQTPSLVLICCAPSEQFFIAKRKQSQHTLMNEFSLDPYRSTFQTNLLNWYQHRTGNVIDSSGINSKILPAQLFFEWWKGQGINDFSTRFRQRIIATKEKELADFFDRLLALNRLNIGYPIETQYALSPQTRDYLNQFERDMHIERPEQSKRGYWFIHPQIAELMYEAWYPALEQKETRVDHLIQALSDSINNGVNISASFQLTERFLALLEDPEIANNLGSHTAIHRVLRAGMLEAARTAASMPNIVLSSWIRVEARLGTSDTDSWSPLEVGIARITTCTPDSLDSGLTHLVSALSGIKVPRANQAVWKLLQKVPEWTHWYPTANELPPKSVPKSQFQELCNFVQEHPNDPGAMKFLARLMSSAERGNPATALAEKFAIGELHSKESLVPIILALYQGTLRSQKVALEWLGEKVLAEHGEFFKVFLTRSTFPGNLVQPLCEWLKHYPNRPLSGCGFAQVISWPRLEDENFSNALNEYFQSLQPQEIPSVLVLKISGMLKTRNGSNPHLFTALPSAIISLDTVWHTLIDWLRDSMGMNSWSHVYTKACHSSIGPNEDLALIGYEWLRKDQFPSLKGFVYESILRIASEGDRGPIARNAITWLNQFSQREMEPKYDERFWGFLAIPVTSAAVNKDYNEIYKSLYFHFMHHQFTQSASYILRALHILERRGYKPQSAPDNLLQQVKTWLASPQLGWAYVYRDFAHQLSDEEKLQVSLKWLKISPEDEQWGAVLYSIVDLISPNDMLHMVGEWFAHGAMNDSHGAMNDSIVGLVWKLAVEEGRHPDPLRDSNFRHAVHLWLNKHGSMRSWWHIWDVMLRFDSSDMETLTAGLTSGVESGREHGVANAVRRTVMDHPEISENVWQALANVYPRELVWSFVCLNLIELGTTEASWLVCDSHFANLAPQEFSSWWLPLWKAFTEDSKRTSLRQRAKEWLQENQSDANSARIIKKLKEVYSSGPTPLSIFRNDES